MSWTFVKEWIGNQKLDECICMYFIFLSFISIYHPFGHLGFVVVCLCIWKIHAGGFACHFILIKMSLEVLQYWTRNVRLQTLEISGPSLLGHWQSSSTYTVICLMAQLYVLTSLSWLIALGKKRILVTVVEETVSNLFCPSNLLSRHCCMVIPRASRVGHFWTALVLKFWAFYSHPGALTCGRRFTPCSHAAQVGATQFRSLLGLEE